MGRTISMVVIAIGLLFVLLPQPGFADEIDQGPKGDPFAPPWRAPGDFDIPFIETAINGVLRERSAAPVLRALTNAEKVKLLVGLMVLEGPPQNSRISGEHWSSGRASLLPPLRNLCLPQGSPCLPNILESLRLMALAGDKLSQALSTAQEPYRTGILDTLNAHSGDSEYLPVGLGAFDWTQGKERVRGTAAAIQGFLHRYLQGLAAEGDSARDRIARFNVDGSFYLIQLLSSEPGRGLSREDRSRLLERLRQMHPSAFSNFVNWLATAAQDPARAEAVIGALDREVALQVRLHLESQSAPPTELLQALNRFQLTSLSDYQQHLDRPEPYRYFLSHARCEPKDLQGLQFRREALPRRENADRDAPEPNNIYSRLTGAPLDQSAIGRLRDEIARDQRERLDADTAEAVRERNFLYETYIAYSDYRFVERVPPSLRQRADLVYLSFRPHFHEQILRFVTEVFAERTSVGFLYKKTIEAYLGQMDDRSLNVILEGTRVLVERGRVPRREVREVRGQEVLWLPLNLTPGQRANLARLLDILKREKYRRVMANTNAEPFDRYLAEAHLRCVGDSSVLPPNLAALRASVPANSPVGVGISLVTSEDKAFFWAHYLYDQAHRRTLGYAMSERLRQILKVPADTLTPDELAMREWAEGEISSFVRQQVAIYERAQPGGTPTVAWLRGDYRTFEPLVVFSNDGLTARVRFMPTDVQKRRQIEQALCKGIFLPGPSSEIRQASRLPGYERYEHPVTPEQSMVWYAHFGELRPENLARQGRPQSGVVSDSSPLTALAFALQPEFAVGAAFHLSTVPLLVLRTTVNFGVGIGVEQIGLRFGQGAALALVPVTVALAWVVGKVVIPRINAMRDLVVARLLLTRGEREVIKRLMELGLTERQALELLSSWPALRIYSLLHRDPRFFEELARVAATSRSSLDDIITEVARSRGLTLSTEERALLRAALQQWQRSGGTLQSAVAGVLSQQSRPTAGATVTASAVEPVFIPDPASLLVELKSWQVGLVHRLLQHFKRPVDLSLRDNQFKLWQILRQRGGAEEAYGPHVAYHMKRLGMLGGEGAELSQAEVLLMFELNANPVWGLRSQVLKFTYRNENEGTVTGVFMGIRRPSFTGEAQHALRDQEHVVLVPIGHLTREPMAVHQIPTTEFAWIPLNELKRNVRYEFEWLRGLNKEDVLRFTPSSGRGHLVGRIVGIDNATGRFVLELSPSRRITLGHGQVLRPQVVTLHPVTAETDVFRENVRMIQDATRGTIRDGQQTCSLGVDLRTGRILEISENPTRGALVLVHITVSDDAVGVVLPVGTSEGVSRLLVESIVTGVKRQR